MFIWGELHIDYKVSKRVYVYLLDAYGFSISTCCRISKLSKKAFMVLLSCGFGFAFEYLLDYFIVGKLHCFDKTETLTIGKLVIVHTKLLINFQVFLWVKV
jgi:hypothetical protein